MALTIGLPPMATPRQNSIRMLPLVEAEVRRRQVKELANLAQRFPASRAHRRGPLVYHRWGRHTVNLRSLGFSFESFAGASGTPQRDSDLRNSRQDLHQALRQTLGIRSAR
jgi:hypothetical protein